MISGILNSISPSAKIVPISISAETIINSEKNEEDLLINSQFPKLGMKGLRFEEFFAKCGGRELLRGKTTTQVCEEYLKPMTRIMEKSYCDILFEEIRMTDGFHSDLTIAPATVFISHAWNSIFIEVVDAFLNHLESSGQSDAVIWFDLFSSNQHQTSTRPFEWWCNTFQSAIRDFGHTVLVLTPWRDPVPLTRTWCLWEIYSSVVMKSRLDIAIVASQQEDFINALETDFESINNMVAKIDVKKSTAFKEEDRIRILQAVEQSEGGISAVNQIVFQQLWQSLTAIALEALSRADRKDIKTYKLMNNVASFLQIQGKYDEALAFFREALDAMRTVLGNEHPDTLAAMSNIGTILRYQGRYDDAILYFKEAMAGKRSVLGNTHPDTLLAIGHMGTVLRDLRKFDEAVIYINEALEGRRAVLGNTHTDTLISINDMGTFLMNQRKFDEALVFYTEALSTRRTVLGNKHPDTLISIKNMGILLCDSGNYTESEMYFKEALASQREVLGENHPDVKNTEGNLAIVLCKLGQVEQGKVQLGEVLQYLRSNNYSENHVWVKKFRLALEEVNA